MAIGVHSRVGVIFFRFGQIQVRSKAGFGFSLGLIIGFTLVGFGPIDLSLEAPPSSFPLLAIYRSSTRSYFALVFQFIVLVLTHCFVFIL